MFLYQRIIVGVMQGDPEACPEFTPGIAIGLDDFRDGQFLTAYGIANNIIAGTRALTDIDIVSGNGNRYAFHRLTGRPFRFYQRAVAVLPAGIQCRSQSQGAVQNRDLLTACPGSIPSVKGIYLLFTVFNSRVSGFNNYLDRRIHIGIVTLDRIIHSAAIGIKPDICIIFGFGCTVNIIQIQIGFCQTALKMSVMRNIIGVAPKGKRINQIVSY